MVMAGVFSLILGAGCSAPAQPGGITGELEKGPVGRAVVALSPQTTGTVDPALQGGASDFMSLEALYSRLAETPPDSLVLGPGVASKWTVSSDGKTVEFEIRKGIRFHNGDELTPEDVIFSMNRVRRLALPNTTAYFDRLLESVEAKGDSVIFKLKEPDWTFINSVSGSAYSIVPKKYIEQVGDAGFLKKPVGSGPFKFVSWSKQEFLELEAVDYQHFSQQPGVKNLRYVNVTEETTRLAMLKTAEADLAQISVTSLKSLAGDSSIRPLKVPNIGGMLLYMFGQGDPSNPLSKLEVRQALSLAIDREAIAKGIYQGYARPLTVSTWNPDMPNFPGWGKTVIKQDMDKARQLLAKAGYPDGKGLKITLHNYEYPTLPLWTQVAPVIRSQWEKLGIQVEMRAWEWGSWAPVARSGKLDPVSVGTHLTSFSGEKGWIVSTFLSGGLYGYASGVSAGAHPQLAEWTTQFDSELDPAKREVLIKKIIEYDRDNTVLLPVLAQDGLWAAGPRLLEYTPRPGTISSGNTWTIKVKP